MPKQIGMEKRNRRLLRICEEFMKSLTNRNADDKIKFSYYQNSAKAMRKKSIYYSLQERTVQWLEDGFKKKI